MGMLLRHRRENPNLTTTECFAIPEREEQKPVEETTKSVKDEKPKTVKRGRPTTKK